LSSDDERAAALRGDPRLSLTHGICPACFADLEARRVMRAVSIARDSPAA
jgi:hypothetical protein